MSRVSAVPLRAEPRKRTWPRAVRRSSGLSAMAKLPLSDGVADRPYDDGEREAADQRRPGELVTQRRVHAVTGVPDEMPDAADQMMEERPGEDEQHQPSDERLDESRKDAE